MYPRPVPLRGCHVHVPLRGVLGAVRVFLRGGVPRAAVGAGAGDYYGNSTSSEVLGVVGLRSFRDAWWKNRGGEGMGGVSCVEE